MTDKSISEQIDEAVKNNDVVLFTASSTCLFGLKRGDGWG